MDLTNEDVADVLALLDSLPYDSLVLETSRFRLTLRRAQGGGWTEESQVLAAPAVRATAGDAVAKDAAAKDAAADGQGAAAGDVLPSAATGRRPVRADRRRGNARHGGRDR